MPVMLDNTSSRLFQTARTGFQALCQRLIDDLLDNGLSTQDELRNRVGQLHLSLDQLKRAGQMMAIDCPTNELVRVVPNGFFTVLIDRPGQDPMPEFDWACIYTADTLNMLISEVFRYRNPTDIAHHLEAQSFLWDLVVPFPVTISHAEDSAPEPYVNALQIPPAASMARMNSRIPVRPRPPPPVDTYLAYNRPVPGPYPPSLPPRPVPEFEPESEPVSPVSSGSSGSPGSSVSLVSSVSPTGPNTTGLYRNPRIRPR
ncbi:unnamed protein product [Penicillium nalgiovense]|uniref:Uncharacterized protein n=1 Tax=Penicillium nalgiovense TaxID=60175 RepID=A0A9W4IE78_PENNA|nr:unnamed protein product [Penicillium nalgiovense]CAG7967854.1 unnamed protein product [Penicillium nalgiovense]CAG7997405.1 unnamed protein product [Penicillium nalgiovense]CAG8019946.1 unnamed protein product [Penicillium nalgiovense]CAG8020293.1 unnamed protein product [Penicillium nalgiovense]